MSKDKKDRTPERRTIARNRRALHDYEILERVEVGLELKGSEVKSLRTKTPAMDQAFARIEKGQAWILGLSIPPYEAASFQNHDPLRKRRLLLHARQIRALAQALESRGRTLIPLEIYFNAEGRVKIDLALGAGKKLFDKRHALAERDSQREIDRALRRRR